MFICVYLCGGGLRRNGYVLEKNVGGVRAIASVWGAIVFFVVLW